MNLIQRKEYINSDNYDEMIPKAPDQLYDEFKNMGDFLGYIGDGIISGQENTYLILFIILKTN